MFLYPHLPHHIAAHIAAHARTVSVAAAAELARTQHSECVYTPTGGNRIDHEQLGELRNVLVAQAAANGYPALPEHNRRLDFDSLVAVALHSRMQIAPAEAAKGGVWEFISCVLAPDLVRWRFSGDADGSSLDRYFAGRRNTFQRLWWRAHLLRDSSRTDNSYALLRLLGEDETVQIMERPNLAGIQALTRQVANGLLAAAERNPEIPRRRLIREAQKRLMRLSSFTAFDAVDDGSLQKLVLQVFDQVAAAVTDNRQ